MIVLEQISPANALIFKNVRLRALQDAPTAFSSTYARESAIADHEWIMRSVRWSSDGAIGYIAFDGDCSCGLVACYVQTENPLRAHVISMWVDPSYRRTGVGKMLINAVQAWAQERRMRDLKLMVTSVNEGAIRFYERIGFRKTGNKGAYPNAPSIEEFEMVLALETASADSL